VFLRDQTIKRRDIPRFLESKDFLSAFSIWKRWTRYGFYNPGGMAGQPAEVIKILDIFEDEKAYLEAEQIEEMKGKHGHHHR